MNKVIIILIAVLVFGSGVYVVLTRGDTEETVSVSESTNQTTSQPETISEPVNNQEVATSTGYIEYTAENLESSKDTKRVVFFHASWCSTCNYFEGQIESAGVPEDITILKANYDKDTDLKKLYGVTVQSTFVLLDSDGNVSETWPFASGLSSIEDLYEAVRI